LTTNIRETSLELDSDADTCCIGKYALLIYEYDRPVTVSGYDPELGSQELKTVLAVLEYTHPLTGQMHHLVIYQAILIPNLDHHLLCPMQCRVNDITINNVPKFLMNTPTQDSHSIMANNVNNPLTPLVLPVYIHSVTSWLPVSKLSLEDWILSKYQTIELTAKQLDWEPSDTKFQESEEAMTSYGGQLVGTNDHDNRLIISSLTSLIMPSADISGDSNLGTILDIRVCKSTHMYFLYPFFRTMNP